MTQGGAGIQDRSGPRSGPPDRDTTDAAAGGVALLAAGQRLFAAARHLAVSVTALLAAEARLFKQRIGLAFLAAVALIAFAVSLWACAVALIGWAFRIATGSTGIALALLVALHLILIAASWLWIKHGIHQASFPGTRVELAALRHGWRRSPAEHRATAAAAARGHDSGS